MLFSRKNYLQADNKKMYCFQQIQKQHTLIAKARAARAEAIKAAAEAKKSVSSFNELCLKWSRSYINHFNKHTSCYDDQCLIDLSYAIAHSVLKKIIDAGKNSVQVLNPNMLVKDQVVKREKGGSHMLYLQRIKNGMEADKRTILYSNTNFAARETAHDGSCIMQETALNILDITEKSVYRHFKKCKKAIAEARAARAEAAASCQAAKKYKIIKHKPVNFLEIPYNTIQLKKKVWIKEADSKALERVIKTPIVEIFKSVRRYIDSCAETQPLLNKYLYIDSLVTINNDGSSNYDQIEYQVYKRYHAYYDLISVLADQDRTITAADYTIDEIEQIIKSLKLSPQQNIILNYRRKGYGKAAIATALNIKPSTVRVQLERIQKKVIDLKILDLRSVKGILTATKAEAIKAAARLIEKSKTEYKKADSLLSRSRTLFESVFCCIDNTTCNNQFINVSFNKLYKTAEAIKAAAASCYNYQINALQICIDNNVPYNFYNYMDIVLSDFKIIVNNIKFLKNKAEAARAAAEARAETLEAEAAARAEAIARAETEAARAARAEAIKAAAEARAETLEAEAAARAAEAIVETIKKQITKAEAEARALKMEAYQKNKKAEAEAARAEAARAAAAASCQAAAIAREAARAAEAAAKKGDIMKKAEAAARAEAAAARAAASRKKINNNYYPFNIFSNNDYYLSVALTAAARAETEAARAMTTAARAAEAAARAEAAAARAETEAEAIARAETEAEAIARAETEAARAARAEAIARAETEAEARAARAEAAAAIAKKSPYTNIILMRSLNAEAIKAAAIAKARAEAAAIKAETIK